MTYREKLNEKLDRLPPEQAEGLAAEFLFELERAAEADAMFDNLTPGQRARLKDMIQEGIDSLDRGEGIPGEQVFEALRARYRRMADELKA